MGSPTNVDGRARIGRRPGLGPRLRSQACWASRPRATRRSSTQLPMHSEVGGSFWWSTTASTSSPPRDRPSTRIPVPLPERQGPLHNRETPTRSTGKPCSPWRRGRWRGHDLDAVALFVDRARAVRPDSDYKAPRHGRRGDRDLRDPGRLPAGDMGWPASRMAAMSTRSRFGIDSPIRFRLLKGSKPRHRSDSSRSTMRSSGRTTS